MTIRQQVTEFHEAFGFPVRSRPQIPPDAEARLRARLIIEEAFEALEAIFPRERGVWRELLKASFANIDAAMPAVDLVALADALGDLDYVVEGTRLATGIDGSPIAAEIHRSNLAKRGGPIDDKGKQRKPADWTPPDIASELEAQGWVRS